MERNDPFDNVQSNAIYAPEVLEKQLLHWGGSFAGVASAPAEMILRPRFGSTHLSPVSVIAATAMLWIATVIGMFLEAAWESNSGGPRPVGMLQVTLVFHVLLAVHGVRVWKLMTRPELEEDSKDEGPAWPFYRFLPRASWAMVRVIYEPITVLVASFALFALGVTATTVFLYGIFVAQMLMLRNGIQWYQLFLMIREAIDGRNRAKTLMDVVKGLTRPDTVNPGIVARVAGIPADDQLRIARVVTGIR